MGTRLPPRPPLSEEPRDDDHRHRHHTRAEGTEGLGPGAAPQDPADAADRAGDRIRRIRRRLERLIGIAATEVNSVRPLRDGDEILTRCRTPSPPPGTPRATACLGIAPERWHRRSVLQRARELSIRPLRRSL
ncbi:hypothetical protein [Streptomyces sp. NPDC090021]|uniref:hypothetical protein n=1 Tax=Streptomyces sp. NPDC090021 TaxID=3365919 RepID=UPI00381B2184